MFAVRSKSQPVRRPAMMGTGIIPASVKGLNLRSGITALKPDEALIMDNWRPGTNYQEVRGGYESYATTIGASVGTLMEWAGPSSRKFFAAKSTAIYDISTSGAVGSAESPTVTNAYFQHVIFTTSGGTFLVACNGADDVLNYDGSSWTTPSITGATSADLINVASHKSRLWFVEKDSTKAWYLGTSSIAGAATAFDLGDKFRKGGKLQLIGSLSQDSGDGMDDMLCFISSTGEVVVYQGNNPDDSNDWSLAGVYQAAPPIGNRALMKVGGDLGLLTEHGILSVRQVMGQGQAAAERSSITGNIDQGIIDAFRSYGTLTGWEMIYHPRTRQALVNIPKSSSTAYQFALNTLTGAWSTYGLLASPLNAMCWGIYNKELYFGTSGGTVYHAETGHQDNGNAITCTWKPSFQARGRGGMIHRVTMCRPLILSGGRVNPAVRVNVDYRNDVALTSDEYPSDAGSIGAVWDTAKWDQATWGDDASAYADWITADGIGTASTIYMGIRPNGIAVKLASVDLKFEMGQSLAL